MSSTTPTTVSQGPIESAGPRLKRLPTASPAGHKRRASASLTIATRADSGPSLDAKKRPPSKRAPSDRNNSPPTSSLRNCRRSDTVPPLRSVVSVRSGLLLMKASLMKPARSTPGSDSTRASTRR